MLPIRIIFLLVITTHSVQAELRLSSFFGDHMVLQREQALPVWGSAEPGSQVTVSFRRSQVTTTADDSGQWLAKLPPQGLGQPGKLRVQSAGETLELKDVLVGEVWICSGQSNMQWTVSQAADAEAEIAAADYPSIRLINVPNRYAVSPQSDFEGSWEVCSPDTVGDFSAVGYYFGRELWQTLQIPIGLVSSNWGGTPAEAWTPLKTLESDPAYSKIVADSREAARTLKEQPNLAEEMQARFDAFTQRIEAIIDDLPTPADSLFDPEFEMENAQPIQPATNFLKETEGLVHVRKVFTLSAEQAAKDGAVLKLGQIDNFDCTWLNGTVVGKTGPEGSAPRRQFREYPIPAGTLKAGANVALLQIVDIRNIAHFGHNVEQPAIVWPDGSSHGLKDDWKMTLVADAGKRPGLLDDRMKDMGAFLWNGMIAPLKPAAFRGVIWYQGESNASRAKQYRTLFPDMIQAWRDEWGRGDFPFYFVQLANFSDQEGWPELREAQTMALELPETGMAVSIDIGDPDDIHPKNKQDVGRRLALWALAKTYGQTEPRSLLGRLPVVGEHFQKPIPHSGPLFEKARFRDEQVQLSFNHVYGGLETRDGDALRGFTIAGDDGIFREADAEIDGEAIIVSHPEIDRPTAVRYAWGINPDANLVNSAGLPASPFRVDR